jgi:hypothetical protein
VIHHTNSPPTGRRRSARAAPKPETPQGPPDPGNVFAPPRVAPHASRSRPARRPIDASRLEGQPTDDRSGAAGQPRAGPPARPRFFPNPTVRRRRRRPAATAQRRRARASMAGAAESVPGHIGPRSPMTTGRKSFLLATIGIACGVAVLLAGRSLWRAICGNSPIAFYGRVVDDRGNGLAGVDITFEGFYSDRPVIPAPHFGSDKRWRRTVLTDHNGDFELRGVYGHSVRSASARSGGAPIGLAAVGLAPSADPMYGVSLNTISSRLLPDTPQKRVTYRVVPLK